MKTYHLIKYTYLFLLFMLLFFALFLLFDFYLIHAFLGAALISVVGTLTAGLMDRGKSG